jgi:hypothetical protein
MAWQGVVKKRNKIGERSRIFQGDRGFKTYSSKKNLLEKRKYPLK